MDHRRAKHTLSQLHLNKRSLPEQRVAVYRRAYRESLDGYVRQKLSGNRPAHPDLTHLTHRLVWEEMKRQATRPDLAPLFGAAPEALAW